MKTFLGSLCIALMFIGCANTRMMGEVKESEKDMIIAHDITMPQDTTKTIVVYNVVESDNKKTRISDEIIRMFIADLFGTITTIITLKYVETP